MDAAVATGREAVALNLQRICGPDGRWYAPIEELQTIRSDRYRVLEENERLRDAAVHLQNRVLDLAPEVERLRESLLTVVEQVESCCSRSGLCIDADRIRAEAQRPMDGRYTADAP